MNKDDLFPNSQAPRLHLAGSRHMAALLLLTGEGEPRAAIGWKDHIRPSPKQARPPRQARQARDGRTHPIIHHLRHFGMSSEENHCCPPTIFPHPYCRETERQSQQSQEEPHHIHPEVQRYLSTYLPYLLHPTHNPGSALDH